MNITDQVILDIKHSNNIVSVIEEYVELKRVGNSPWLVGLCPFHVERYPSFKVHETNQTWYCFGCGRGSKESGTGSDVFAFIKEIKGVDFIEACKILADRASIDLIDKPEDPMVSQLKNTMTEHNRRYVLNLWDSNNKLAISALDYLRNTRKLTDATICNWRLGLVPQDEINKRIDISGISGKLSIAIIENKTEGAKTLGMSYRSPVDSPPEPKYMNDHTSPCFKKGSLLYGLNFAAPHIKKEKFGIFTECFFGTMILHQYGIKNVVSTMGAALTESQAKAARRHSKYWIFLYDSDEAGRNAVIRALPLCLKEGIEVYSVRLPLGYDPDEFMIHCNSKDRMMDYIKSERELVLDKFINESIEAYERDMINKRIELLGKIDPILSILDGSYRQLWREQVYKRINNI